MRVILLFIGCLLFQFSNAQLSKKQEIDSLNKVLQNLHSDTAKCIVLNEISNAYLYSNYNEGLANAKLGLSLSKKSNWSKGIGLSNTNIAKHLISKGDFKGAHNYLKSSESIFIGNKDNYNLANVYNQFGILNANKGKFPDALDYFFKSLAKYEKTNEPKTALRIANLYQNIANIYSATENNEKAILNYDKSIAIFETLDEQTTSLAINIASKGTVYQKQKKYNEAIEALKKAEKILAASDDKFALSFVLSWLGSAYLAAEEYEKSIDYSNKSLVLITEMGDQVLIASTIQNIGAAYLKNGIFYDDPAQIELGKTNLSKSLSMNESSENIELLQNDYKYLSQYYDYTGEYKRSLELYKKYTDCNISLYNTKNKQTLKNLEDERTIQLNKKQIQLNKLTLENKEKQKWYMLSGLGLVSVLGILLFIQSRNRKRINKKLLSLNSELDQANKAKARFFSILNHDLRAPVASLAWFLQMQKENPEIFDEESKMRIQDKTILGVENLLISMEDILQWSKSQMENFKPVSKPLFVKQLFHDIKLHFEAIDFIEFEFQDVSNIQVITDENYLKTIVRNLTSNSVKALDGIEFPKIAWKAWQENNKTYFSISDNGIGASKEQLKALYDDKASIGINSGLGLHLIRDLGKAIDCKIYVESESNIGTTFILEL